MLRASKVKRKSVLLVDDHPLVRQALRGAIEREVDLVVCGEAEDSEGAFKAIEASKPDLAIVDLGLRNSNGLELIKDIRSRHPQMFTLVLSMQDESLYAERAVRAGASGYISKQEAATKVMQAVRTVLGGQIYWSEKVAAQVASKVARPARGATSRWPEECLSERELQIFELIGVGASTSQISASLHIDVSTVETYRRRIKEKLDLKDAGELRQSAIRWNLGKAKAVGGLVPVQEPG
jgi:DNA-binding NarL/FixJ family response regulator